MIDLLQSRAYLSTLSSGLPGDCRFTFQTIDDDKDRLRENKKTLEHDPFASIIHGTFEECEDELVHLNALGAGIFVTVSMTDVKGRRLSNIVGLRAVFIDDDDGKLSDTPSDYEVPPSIIVKSARGRHVYWLVDRWTEKDLFRKLQIALAKKFGTDDRIIDLARVMRLPGFLHQKGEPVGVALELAEERRYTHLELIEGLGLELPDLTPRHATRQPTRTEFSTEDKVARCRGYLMKGIGPATEGSGTGHFDTISACRAGHDFDLGEGDFLPLLRDWGSICSPAWEWSALEREYLSVIRSDHGTAYPAGNKLDDPKHYRPGNAKAYQVLRTDDVPWQDDYQGRRPVKIGRLADVSDAPERDVPWAEEKNNRANSKPFDEDPEELSEEDPDDEPDDEPDDDGQDDSPAPRKKKKKKSRRIGQSLDVLFSTEVPTHRDSKNEVAPRRAVREMMNDYLFLYNLGQMYVYYDFMWTEIEESMIGKIAWQYFPYRNFKHKLISETIRLLRERATKKKIPWNSIEYCEIPMRGGILDLRTNEMRPHLPEDYLDRLIPYDYDPDAECPMWHRVLEDWLPGKDEEKRALQQFFGYIMMTRANYKKALLLYGDTDTGKTQVCNMACRVVGGVEYTCGILPSQMGDPRARAPIKGMGLNIIPDLSKREIIDDGGFKSLVSSSEPIQLDKKFAQPETYVPTAKHMFAMNNLPAVTDATSAVFRRMLIIAFDATVPMEKQDPQLDEKLMGEIEGIIAWSVRGAIALHDNNGIWPRVSSSDLIVEEYRHDQNPLFDFIEESGTVTADPEGSITIEDLRTLFNEYHGTRPWTKKAVRDKVNALGYIECRKDKKRAVKGIVKSGPQQVSIPSYLTPIDGGLSGSKDSSSEGGESEDKT